MKAVVSLFLSGQAPTGARVLPALSLRVEERRDCSTPHSAESGGQALVTPTWAGSPALSGPPFPPE